MNPNSQVRGLGRGQVFWGQQPSPLWLTGVSVDKQSYPSLQFARSRLTPFSLLPAQVAPCQREAYKDHRAFSPTPKPPAGHAPQGALPATGMEDLVLPLEHVSSRPPPLFYIRSLLHAGTWLCGSEMCVA